MYLKYFRPRERLDELSNQNAELREAMASCFSAQELLLAANKIPSE